VAAKARPGRQVPATRTKPAPAAVPAAPAAVPAVVGGYPGQRLGLPADGPGSVARQGRRLGGLALDLVAGGLIGGLVRVVDPHVSEFARGWATTGAFVVEVLVLTTLTGQSIGMRLTGTRLIWRDGGRPPLRWAALRLFLFCFPPLMLALLMDADQRGLHDRAAGTVLVRV
jgi:uncharacterized RDD family membrane protein YckC